MRRAAVQALRTARRSHHVRKYFNTRSVLASPLNHVPGFRLLPGAYERGQLLSPLQSTLYRNFAYAFISTLVASGAWAAYKDKPAAENSVQVHPTQTSLGSSPIIGSLGSTSSPSTMSQASTDAPLITAEDRAEITRRALVVENDQFFAGDIVGDEPISKETDHSGRLVLEMLTPEQATQKLRQNEQSFLVGRGQGVLRYDVVQLASNNPIEDDHVEKIIEVPGVLQSVKDGSARSDWMFWGVFDGHRYYKSHLEAHVSDSKQWLDYICKATAGSDTVCCERAQHNISISLEGVRIKNPEP